MTVDGLKSASRKVVFFGELLWKQVVLVTIPRTAVCKFVGTCLLKALTRIGKVARLMSRVSPWPRFITPP